MDGDVRGELSDDVWSEASEGEQQSWLRSALHECETKPLIVDPRYEIPLEDVGLGFEDNEVPSSLLELSMDSIPPRRKGGSKQCSVSSSMPNFSLKMLSDVKSSRLEAIKASSYPRRRSSGTHALRKCKNSTPGFMRDTEAWTKRRTSSIAADRPVRSAVIAPVKRQISALCKSVCSLPSKIRSLRSSQATFAKHCRNDSHPTLKARSSTVFTSKPKVKRSRKLAKSYNRSQHREGFIGGAFEHFDSLNLRTSSNLDPVHSSFSSSSCEFIEKPQPQVRRRARKPAYPGQMSLPASKWLTADSFIPKKVKDSASGSGRMKQTAETEGEPEEDMCLMGLNNEGDDDASSVDLDISPTEKSPPARLELEMDQLRKALSNVSLMYQDQVQCLKLQLDSSIEKAQYDQKQIAILKRRLIEATTSQQVRGR